MLPLFFRVKIRKGAIQMLKKIISAMLALTLALSLAGVVCASGGPEQGIERVQILEEAVPAGAVPMARRLVTISFPTIGPMARAW